MSTDDVVYIKGSNGMLAAMNNHKQLVVAAIERNEAQQVAAVDEESYTLAIVKTPAGTADCFCYIKNGSGSPMVIHSAEMLAATAETVQFKTGVTGTTSGGTDQEPVNDVVGSTDLLSARATIETGTDITGLSGGNVHRQYALPAATQVNVKFESPIVLKANQTLALFVVTGGVALTINLGMFIRTIGFVDAA